VTAVVQPPQVTTSPQVRSQKQSSNVAIPGLASAIDSKILVSSANSVALNDLDDDSSISASPSSLISENMSLTSIEQFRPTSTNAADDLLGQSDSSNMTDDASAEEAGIKSDASHPLSPSSVNTATATDSLGRLPTFKPGTTGEVSPLNIGTIVGIVIGILSVIAVFLLFWFRSRRKRRRGSGITSISSPMSFSTDGGNSNSTWVEFGGAKGSILSDKEETVKSDKAAPIYTMFSRSRHAAQGGDAQNYTRSKYGLLTGLSSGKSGNEPGKFPSSPIKATPTQLVSPLPINAPRPAYQQAGGTSFFARLLSNPIVPPAEPIVHKEPSAPHTSVYTVEGSQTSPMDPNFRSSCQVDGFLYDDDALDEIQGLDDRSDYAGSGQKISIYCHTPTRLRSSQFLMPSLDRDNSSSHNPPNLAWSARSLSSIRDVSVIEDGGDDGDDARAASTRAPSLDLAWVTRSDTDRIAVPSWAQQPKRRVSTKSRKSAKSARPSFGRRSVMSSRSGSSMPTARSGRSSGYIPDLPSPSSLPYFKSGVPSSIYIGMMNEVVPPSPAPSHATNYI
jgi:hypothetical protein